MNHDEGLRVDTRKYIMGKIETLQYTIGELE